MESQLWGEIPEPRNTEWDKVVPKEIGKLVILSAIKMEPPKVKQPQPDEHADNNITVGPEHSTMEQNVLYTIKLIQHARQVDDLIRVSNSMIQDEEPSVEVKECPPMPQAPTQEIKQEETFPSYKSREESPFTLGEPIVLPELGREVTKEILYKSVSTLCAHAGYDSGMQSSLQVLTDVAEDFFKKFTRLLRYAVDREDLYGNSGFPDAMERVFHEMGLGSVTRLHDFYQSRVLQYRDQCQEKCQKLVQQYEALLPTIKREPDELVRFKTEMESEEDIPEIHFPAMAEGDCVDELQSSLEPGFQMLHSLEQEVAIKYGTV
ncbi:STAGA complex 65 subunit gamma-like [Homalodisca vitripennis]|uniref:STAGA complex 65 subunit gamma-like n=1 Tax=Homalodisca vitripennis TaxID=197043 RepID=UPI001EEA709F|nr:STAGA complex 65 subunit gamma-like [Homalodisca vitripennis]XP_046676177.1 STAGA complex 65 subunit gamma-like [Homalodisca vitripennis]XP_046676178.1 STAGA complex 65 subunit gamma-like [Homalodisca vitripennis]XP_046676179.1 STAGA complex 65 subunit gamma-like [Homalodisca vitripennis]XP_046676180.1 STAGA complex 65 subunit gamma-like [Homalodisca vitripennis]XP_046676181.1 STAGA complex 65 subunit gamma-like [Homalodisca vitripennis]XP_046676182.1 STAGA complex 65 subunit gamma-like [H